MLERLWIVDLGLTSFVMPSCTDVPNFGPFQGVLFLRFS
jgi:hypothetical protein